MALVNMEDDFKGDSEVQFNLNRIKADAVDLNAAPSLAPAESFGDQVPTREIELVRRSSTNILSIDDKASAHPRRVDRTRVRSIVMAKRWVAMLDSGEVASIDALARQEHFCQRNTARVLPLAYLAPDLVEMILAGCQPITLTLY